MSVNYDRVCRLCLSSRGELLPIFPTTSSDDSEPAILASKIKECVSVQINENDDLPTNVCRKCVDNVNNWHIFKRVCDRSQNKLQSLIAKDGSLLEEVKIKKEPLYDETYDDGVVIDGSYPDLENDGPSTKVQPEGPPILASLGLTPRSDKKDIDPRMDWQRVHAILDMVQDDDVIDALQSNEECDILHLSDHDSESDIELHSDVEDELFTSANGYLNKDGSTISKSPIISNMTINGGVREMMKLRKRIKTLEHLTQPKHAWQKLFTDDLLELIVNSTNNQILAKNKDTLCTNIDEIKTLCGILYFHGIMRPTHQRFSDLWNHEYGVICIRNAMKLERFTFLLQNLSFEQNNGDLMQIDTMKRMRNVFEIFALNCRTAFDIDNTVVVDEIIVPVYGPCPFRYQIDKKPLKRGIKMVMLVDATNMYVSNLDIITDPYFGADDIIVKLVQHLAGTGRTIVMDKWYSSSMLMEKLKSEYKLYTITAVDENDAVLPPLFLSKHRKHKSLMTGFVNCDVTLTSYTNTEGKSVNVLTNEPTYYKKTHVYHKTAVSMYKKHQSAVELLDVLMQYYTTMQQTNDWALSIFFTLLNIASINAQVIWSSNNPANVVVKRRLFIKDLAISILKNDPTSLGSVPLRLDISMLTEHIASGNTRKRCKICRSLKRDRRTKSSCARCHQFFCRGHLVNICAMCVV